MRKRLLTVICLLTTAGVFSAKAADYTVKGDTLIISGITKDDKSFELDEFKNQNLKVLALQTDEKKYISSNGFKGIAPVFQDGSGFSFTELNISEAATNYFLGSTSYNVPDNTFASWSRLESIIISSDCGSIGASSFKNSGLKELKVAGVEYTGENTLPTMIGFGIGISKTKAIIGKSAFEGTKLENFTLPMFCFGIGDRAFADNPYLKSVTVKGPAVAFTKRDANFDVDANGIFAGCTGLETYKMAAETMLYGVDIMGAKDVLMDIIKIVLNDDTLMGLISTFADLLIKDFDGGYMDRMTGVYFTDIPASVQAKLDLSAWGFIPAYTFKGHPVQAALNQNRIVMPQYVFSIGHQAYMNSDLTNISMPIEVGSLQTAVSSLGLTSINDIIQLIFNYVAPESTLPAFIDQIFAVLVQKLDVDKLFPAIGDEAFANTQLSHVRFPMFVNQIGEKAFAGTPLKTVLVEGPANPAVNAFEGCQLDEYRFSVATMVYAIRINEILDKILGLGKNMEISAVDMEEIYRIQEELGFPVVKSMNTKGAIADIISLLKNLLTIVARLEMPSINDMTKTAYASVRHTGYTKTKFNYNEWFFVPQEAFKDVDFTDYKIPTFLPYCIFIEDRAFENATGFKNFKTPLLCVSVGKDVFKNSSLDRLKVFGPLHLVGENAFGENVNKVEMAGTMLAFDLPTYKTFFEWIVSLIKNKKDAEAAFAELDPSMLEALGIDLSDEDDFDYEMLKSVNPENLVKGILDFGVNTTARKLFTADNAAFGGAEGKRPKILLHEWMFIPENAFRGCTTNKITLSPICLSVGANSFQGDVKQVKFTAPAILQIGENAFTEETMIKLGGFVAIAPDMVVPRVYESQPNAMVDITEWLVVPTESFRNIESIKYVGVKFDQKKQPGALFLNSTGVYIKPRAFENCTSLEEVYLPMYSKLGNRSFANTGLKQVTLGAWDKYHEETFADNTSLEFITFDETVEIPFKEILPEVKYLVIAGISALDQILSDHIDEKKPIALAAIMAELEKLGNVPVIGNLIYTIIENQMDKIFDDINAGFSLFFNDVSDYIDNNWFALKRSTLGITSDAFNRIPALHTADIHMWTNVSENAFKGITSLQHIAAMPQGAYSFIVGKSAFEGCEALILDENALINSSAIHSNAFAGVQGVEQLNLSTALTYLGDDAFANTAIEKIHILRQYDMDGYAFDDATIIASNNAFAGIDGLHTIYAQADLQFEEGTVVLPEDAHIIVTEGGNKNSAHLASVKHGANEISKVRVKVSAEQEGNSVAYRNLNLSDGNTYIYLPTGRVNGENNVTSVLAKDEHEFILRSENNELHDTITPDHADWTLCLAAEITGNVADAFGKMEMGYADQGFNTEVANQTSFLYPLGDELLISALPEESYELKTLEINGEEVVAADNVYTLTVKANTDVVCSFAMKTTNDTDNPTGIEGSVSTGTQVTASSETINIVSDRAIQEVRVIDVNGRLSAMTQATSTEASVQVQKANLYIVQILFADGTTEVVKISVR